MNTLLRTLMVGFFAVLFQVTAFAQSTERIEKTTIEFEKQRVDALTILLQPERKEVQKAFDDWMDDRYDIKMKGGGLFGDKNIRQAEAVVIPAISPVNISLYTKTEERADGTQMSIFASRGLGNFIGEQDYDAFSGIEDVFDSFLSNYLPEYYEDRVAEAREALEDLQKDFTDAEKDVAKNEERIRDLENENGKLRDEMKDLEQKIRAAEETLKKRENVKNRVERIIKGM